MHSDDAMGRVLLAVVLAATVAAGALAPVAAQENDTANGTTTDTSDGGFTEVVGEATADSVAVVQGDTCYNVRPLGDGSESVESFYHPPGEGANDLRLSGRSQVFLYDGSRGTSLVFLHDQAGDRPSGAPTGGGTVALALEGLPLRGEWVVTDDEGGTSADEWTGGGSEATVTWSWSGNEADGGAYRGLESGDWETVRIDPAFNRESPRFPVERWNGQPDENLVNAWVLRSAGGTAHELAMDEPVELRRGACRPGASTATTDGAGSGTGTAGTDEAGTTAAGGPGTTTTTAAEGPGFTALLGLVALLVGSLALVRR